MLTEKEMFEFVCGIESPYDIIIVRQQKGKISNGRNDVQKPQK